jgi:proteasome lid subunit RPN8/RPN11
MIDHGVLAGFRARAIRGYPYEYAELLWGHKDTEEQDAYLITVIERAHVESDHESADIETDWDFGEKQNGEELLGTLHSHPDDLAEPSDCDLEDAALHPVEKIFGIMALEPVVATIENPKRQRWLTSFCFYQTDGTPVELVVSKPERKRRKP